MRLFVVGAVAIGLLSAAPRQANTRQTPAATLSHVAVERTESQLHNRAGAFDLALGTIRQSLAVDAEQPLAWVYLGIALAGQGDPGGALGAYEEAIRLKRFEDALRHARRAVEFMPGHANSRQMLADLEPALGR